MTMVGVAVTVPCQVRAAVFLDRCSPKPSTGRMRSVQKMMPALPGRRLHPASCPGLVPGVHANTAVEKKGVDGRDKPGHDGGGNA